MLSLGLSANFAVSHSLFKMAIHPAMTSSPPKLIETKRPTFGRELVALEVIKPSIAPARVYDMTRPRLYSQMPELLIWHLLPRLAQTSGAHMAAQCRESRRLDDMTARILMTSVGSIIGNWKA